MAVPSLCRLLPPALLGAAALAVAGCGSDDGVVVQKDAPQGTHATSPPPDPVPASSAAARGPVLPGSGAPVRSTPPGTLRLGSFATVAHEEYIGSKFYAAPLRVSITSLSTGSQADLTSYTLDAGQRASTPYYVHARFQNLSKRSYNAVGLAGGLTVYDSAGVKIPRLDLVGGFKPCEAAGPDRFPPGARTATCDVFLVPKGRTLGTVRYSDKYGAQYAWAG